MSARTEEQARVRRHLEGALEALLGASTEHLTAGQRARRAGLVGHLRGYIDAGRFPVNRTGHPLTPVFVDGEGARCAVASMLDATGEESLVQAVAAGNNLARVHALAELPAVRGWLEHHGIGIDEAARVQPMYAAIDQVDWRPAVAAVAEVGLGWASESGGQLTFSPGVRAGVRRVVRAQDTSGTMSYSSLGVMAEYARSLVLRGGGAHQLGVMVQWEPRGHTSDAQWYLLAGPVVALDGDGAPGTGGGGRVGVGFSFRGRTVPLLGEVGVLGLAQGGGLTLRAGLTLGVGW